MTHEHVLAIQWGLNASVIVFSAAAGIAWYRSATAKVLAPLQQGKQVEFQLVLSDGPHEQAYEIIVSGVDVARTVALQSRWNRYAAMSACVAAFIQALQAMPWTQLSF